MLLILNFGQLVFFEKGMRSLEVFIEHLIIEHFQKLGDEFALFFYSFK